MSKKTTKETQPRAQTKAPSPSGAAQSSREQRMSLAEALQAAVNLHQAGRLNDAEDVYRQILAAAPQQPDALSFLGVIALQRGDARAAVELLKQSLEIAPGAAMAHNNLGAAMAALGDFQGAVGCYREAARLNPDYADAQCNLGVALIKAGEYEAALPEFRAVLAKQPDFAAAHLGAGEALRALKRHAAAAASFRKAIKSDASLLPAHIGLVDAQIGMKKFDAALETSEKALALNSFSETAHLAKARVHMMMGEWPKAAESCRKALAIDPENFIALENLGNIFATHERPKDSADCFRKALAINPDRADLHAKLSAAYAKIAKFEAAVAHSRRALEIQPGFPIAHSNLIFTLNYDPRMTPQALFEEATRFGAAVSKSVAPRTTWRAANDASPLRVGIVSADLRRHAVAYFLLSALAALDKGKIRLFAYCQNEKDDEVTTRLQKAIPDWRAATFLSDAELEQRIVDDAINILVDLSGHTRCNRLPVFARRPAPVQATWLGYSGATGLAEMDYVFSDPIELPAEEEPYFTEKPWRLPNTRHCYTPPDEAVDVGPSPAKETGRVTFGVFQRLAKINAEAMACFAQVLKAAPGSRLVFRGSGFGEASVRADVVSAFAGHGVDSGRVEFLERAPRGAYLQYYHRIDIALSPFPWPAVTTGCEGLWMGVPIVFMRGGRFLERSGESILRNLDMLDWLAEDADDYVRIAAAKAADLDALAELRAGLRRRLLASPLCDAPLFARNLEAAFEGMWRKYVESQSQ